MRFGGVCRLGAGKDGALSTIDLRDVGNRRGVAVAADDAGCAVFKFNGDPEGIVKLRVILAKRLDDTHNAFGAAAHQVHQKIRAVRAKIKQSARARFMRVLAETREGKLLMIERPALVQRGTPHLRPADKAIVNQLAGNHILLPKSLIGAGHQEHALLMADIDHFPCFGMCTSKRLFNNYMLFGTHCVNGFLCVQAVWSADDNHLDILVLQHIVIIDIRFLWIPFAGHLVQKFCVGVTERRQIRIGKRLD